MLRHKIQFRKPNNPLAAVSMSSQKHPDFLLGVLHLAGGLYTLLEVRLTDSSGKLSIHAYMEIGTTSERPWWQKTSYKNLFNMECIRGCTYWYEISHFGEMIQYHKGIGISLLVGFVVGIDVWVKKWVYQMWVNVDTDEYFWLHLQLR